MYIDAKHVKYRDLKRHLRTLKNSKWPQKAGVYEVDLNTDFNGLLVQFVQIMQEIENKKGLPMRVLKFYKSLFKEGEPPDGSGQLNASRLQVDGVGDWQLPTPPELLEVLKNLPENTEGFDTYKNKSTGLTPREVMLKLFTSAVEKGCYVDDLMPQCLPDDILISLTDHHEDMALAHELIISVLLMAHNPINRAQTDKDTYNGYMETYRQACLIELFRRMGLITIEGTPFTPSNILDMEPLKVAVLPSVVKGPEGMTITPTPSGLAFEQRPESN